MRREENTRESDYEYTPHEQQKLQRLLIRGVNVFYVEAKAMLGKL